MRKIFRLTALLSPVMALTLYSCIKDPDWGRAQEASSQEVEAARAFFERYAAGLPALRPVGITPGSFAPEWEKATAISSGGGDVEYLFMPIVAEYTYEGYFAKDYTQMPSDKEGFYHTAIAQKLAVAWDATGKYNCALATIIPAESCATRSHSEVERMLYGGDANARFSGVLMFSTLEDGGYTLIVYRYHEGAIAAHRSVYNADNTSAENAKAMAELVGAAKLIKKRLHE